MNAMKGMWPELAASKAVHVPEEPCPLRKAEGSWQVPPSVVSVWDPWLHSRMVEDYPPERGEGGGRVSGVLCGL